MSFLSKFICDFSNCSSFTYTIYTHKQEYTNAFLIKTKIRIDNFTF